jgi:hypothetical protein
VEGGEAMAARQRERREINPKETLGVTRGLREEKKERERKLEEESDIRVRPVPPAIDASSELVWFVYCLSQARLQRKWISSANG